MTNQAKTYLFRRIPQVDQLMMQPAVQDLVAVAGRRLVLEELTQLLQAVRSAITADAAGDESAILQDLETLPDRLRARVMPRITPQLRTVINATGVILHTNLGRALLSTAAVAGLAEAAGHY